MGSGDRSNTVSTGIWSLGNALYHMSYKFLIPLHPLTEPPFCDAGNKHWLVSHPTNPHFVGRREVIDRIIKRITPEDAQTEQKRVVLTGMGGQGKSEICLRVANEVRHR